MFGGLGLWFVIRLIVLSMFAGASLGLSVIERQPVAFVVMYSTYVGLNHLWFVGVPCLVIVLLSVVPEQAVVTDFIRSKFAGLIRVIRGVRDAVKEEPKAAKRSK